MLTMQGARVFCETVFHRRNYKLEVLIFFWVCYLVYCLFFCFVREVGFVGADPGMRRGVCREPEQQVGFGSQTMKVSWISDVFRLQPCAERGRRSENRWLLSDLPLGSEGSYWINVKSVHWSVLGLDDWHCVVNSGKNCWAYCLSFPCNGSINHSMINMLTGTFFIFCHRISSSKRMD